MLVSLEVYNRKIKCSEEEECCDESNVIQQKKKLNSISFFYNTLFI